MNQTVIGSQSYVATLLNLKAADKKELKRKLNSPAYNQYAKGLIRLELTERDAKIKSRKLKAARLST